MEKSVTSEVVCCSQCPDGNCPDCPVAEAKKNNRWWKKLAKKIGFPANSKSDKGPSPDKTADSK
jgi:hypothetical protein